MKKKKKKKKKRMELGPDLSDSARNSRLGKHLRSRGYFAIEVLKLDGKQKKEVLYLIVAASNPGLHLESLIQRGLVA